MSDMMTREGYEEGYEAGQCDAGSEIIDEIQEAMDEGRIPRFDLDDLFDV